LIEIQRYIITAVLSRMRDFKKYHKKSLKKFGGKEKVRIFAARLRNNGKFIDNTERDNEVKKKRSKRNFSL